MTYAILAYTFIAVALGCYGFFFLRIDGWRKWVAIPSYLAVCFVCLLLSVLSLGRPIPANLLFNKVDLEVVAVQMVEPVAIYVWAYPEGSNTPVAIVLPWQQEKASEVAGVMAEVREQGGVLKITPDDDTIYAEKQKEILKEPSDGLR